jgi:hypothetical protein
MLFAALAQKMQRDIADAGAESRLCRKRSFMCVTVNARMDLWRSSARSKREPPRNGKRPARQNEFDFVILLTTPGEGATE